MRSYFPYIIGAFAGALTAILLSNFFGLSGTPQLVMFGCLPALGGALLERFAQRPSQKP
ncbi:hypothetical protein [Rhizobium leguminosarum]|uniref:hypothetical protein n=1 Tax=Rhizobium leguminosarum TaxID=384 RepID=UPI0013EEE6F8|nr:hypothetical protein [Rhizobium leguminosarum]